MITTTQIDENLGFSECSAQLKTGYIKRNITYKVYIAEESGHLAASARWKKR